MEHTINSIYSIFLAAGQKLCTDTRKLEKGQIFFALKGPNFDGNMHAVQAISQGAKYAIVDDENLKTEKGCIYVKDVLKLLQELALLHRRTLNTPIIAITGSNGKTTTKELIKEVLSKKYKVAYTKGNLNNHIGIPITILAIKAYEDIAIVEMGANHIGEIESYCAYTEPNYALITNIGKAHLEGFGGMEGVIKGKTELYKYIEATNGLIFIHSNDPILKEHSDNIRKVEYNSTNAIPASTLDSEFLTVNALINNQEIAIHSNLTGEYNVSNILAACKIGEFFEVSALDIKEAIEVYQPTNSRSQIIKKNDLTIILDAYNANPSSMEVGIKNLEKANTKKLAILGAMKELGEYSLIEHQRIIDLCIECNINQVILVGTEFEECKIPSNFTVFKSNIEAKVWYEAQSWTNETILFKGSRGVALEKILE